MGSCVFWARFSGTIAPQVLLLVSIYSLHVKNLLSMKLVIYNFCKRWIQINDKLGWFKVSSKGSVCIIMVRS